MKQFFFLLLIVLLIGSCSTPDKRELSASEIEARKMRTNDSLIIEMDSLMRVKIDLPQLVDEKLISVECVDDFNMLAQATGGEVKVVLNSNFVTRAILDIVNNTVSDNTDVMIVMDVTSSMADDIENVNSGLNQILKTLSGYNNVRLSIATYGDKNVDGPAWYTYQSFDTDFEGMKRFLSRIRLTGGGDFPESVYDGVYKAMNEGFWTSSSKRIIMLLGDAPSLDSTLADHNGRDIIDLATRDRINMNFYPIVLSPTSVPDDNPRMEHLSFIENVYPNPSPGLVAVRMLRSIPLTMEVYNQSGELVISKTINESNLRLDLTNEPNGIYIIRVYDQFKNYDTRKLVITH